MENLLLFYVQIVDAVKKIQTGLEAVNQNSVLSTFLSSTHMQIAITVITLLKLTV